MISACIFLGLSADQGGQFEDLGPIFCCDIGCSPGFNPFTTVFSRKSRTHLQERAEQGLAKFAEKQASRQQRFSTLEDRHVTILLPQTKLQREADASESETAEIEKESDADQRELELVAQLWRERQARDDFEGFETAAAKKLRLLRAAKMYPYVLLRVRLPGGVYLQARFTVDESLEVREVARGSIFRLSTHVYDVIAYSIPQSVAHCRLRAPRS